MATLLPFKAEYAKSGRAGCKMCKEKIDKGMLRLAIMKPSPFHDGRDAHWFHKDCFFSKHHPPSVGDIEDFESLRYEDQKLIKSKIGPGLTAPGPSGRGKKAATEAAAQNFKVEYAKSGRSECLGCNQFIPAKAVRISKKDFTSDKALQFGGPNGLDRWYHVDCFVKIRDELEFFVAADKNSLPGFKDLDREDQAMVKKSLPAIQPAKRKLEDAESNGSGGTQSKKVKTENGKDQGSSSKDEKAIQKQNKLYYKNRDAVQEDLKKADQITVLRSNKQNAPDDTKDVLDLVADIMTFGAMERCAECNGQYMYKSGVGYQCRGFLNEFTRCSHVMDGDVKRKPFKVPLDLREHPIFAGKTFKVMKRVIPKHVAPVKAPLSPTLAKKGPKIVKKPLSGFKFVLMEMDKEKKEELVKIIKQFGGETREKCSSTIAAAVMPKEKYDDDNANVNKAKKYGVPVVSSEFVETVGEVRYKLVDELSKYVLSDWVKDIRGRLKTLNDEFEKAPEEEEKKSVKLRMKDGAVIDPQSELDDGPYHVFKEGKMIYNCVLNRTDVDAGTNSYYKMQIIESDGYPKEYHWFRSWGRIGTTSGGAQTNEQPSKQDAIQLFEEKFMDMTGNIWGQKFVRKPGKYFNVDIDYGESKELQKLVPSTETSRLPLPVQGLVSLIFDVDIMKKTLLEFEIDMEKMPLGKISRKQLLEAYSVLTDALELLKKQKDQDEEEEKLGRKMNRLIADVSNRFYTLIPHSFGASQPPLLDNDSILKMKIEMLDNLMEIEIAYDLMAQEDKEGGSSIDSHYQKLNASIDILEAHSEEFKILSKYLSNTHAPTHQSYTLEIDQIFKVNRNGENERYQPFKELHNRRLLWHGSRISNFAGIISQGLRIAPPEAPVTGYMFGKGIYFADMVSKSANYCYTSHDNPTGLLLLCEVALGDMHELKQAKDSLTKPPKKCHSVKGLGETEPDPKDTHTFEDGVLVPFGKPKKSKIRDTALLYNEYIVYDIAQVNVKYLLKVNFNYGKPRHRK